MLKRLRDHLFTWLTDEPPPREVIPYDFDRIKYELHPGDVILVEGRSRISHAIRTITQSPWTHAALYIGRMVDYEDDDIQEILRKHTDAKEKTRLIIEGALDKGTIVLPLATYHQHHIRICRPKGITPTDLALVLKYAIKALGQPYNVRDLLDLARFLLPWSILPRRFGSRLFRTASGEPEGGICSSLIASAFLSVQFPILPYVKQDESNHNQLEMFHRYPYLYSPKDFDYSPYFEIIKYPLFDPEEPLPYYRRLPWTKKGLLHQDAGMLSKPKIKKKHSPE